MEVVEKSWKTQGVLRAFNFTFYTLIPNEYHAKEPSNFHLIALCNVILKLITKIITNNLKPSLPQLISQEKSGYVEG